MIGIAVPTAKGNRAAVAGLLIWLAVVAAFSAYTVFGTRQRGSGMDGFLLAMFAILGGGVSLLAVMVWPLNKRATRMSLLIRVIVAASFFGLIGVVRYGSYLYSRDQEEAKRFVESRIAAVRASSASNAFPATQDEFVNHQALPRLLRNQKFYFYDGGSDFHIEIRVDFDGWWRYTSNRPEWMRST